MLVAGSPWEVTPVTPVAPVAAAVSCSFVCYLCVWIALCDLGWTLRRGGLGGSFLMGSCFWDWIGARYGKVDLTEIYRVLGKV